MHRETPTKEHHVNLRQASTKREKYSDEVERHRLTEKFSANSLADKNLMLTWDEEEGSACVNLKHVSSLVFTGLARSFKREKLTNFLKRDKSGGFFCARNFLSRIGRALPRPYH